MGKSESPVEMVERSDRSGKKRSGFLVWGLMLLLLLLLAALVALGVLFGRGKPLPLLTSRLRFSQEERTVVKRAVKESSQKNDVCITPGCVLAAARILQNMDKSKKPCDNFYQYACGGWLRHHVIPETNSRYSVFDILRDELEVILKGEEWPTIWGIEVSLSRGQAPVQRLGSRVSGDIMPRTWSELGLRCAFVQPDDACPGPEGAPAVTSTSVKLSPLPTGVLEDSDVKDRPAVEKAKILYRSCMNESVIEKRDSKPLLNILDVVGGWPVAMDKWTEIMGPKWELERQLALLNSQFNRRVLIDLFIWNDDQNSSRHVIYIDQPTLGMPSREYYFQEGSNHKSAPWWPRWPKPPSSIHRPLAQVREAYLHFMMSVATMLRKDLNLPKDNTLVQEDMTKVLELEAHLANATVPQEERHDVTSLYHRMDLVELQERFGLKGFNWTLFIQSVLSSVQIDLLPDEEVVVYGIPYLQNLEDVIDIYSARTMQNYLVWRLVLDRISSLSQRFKDARVHYRKALYGTTVEEVRWRECVSYVNSNMESAVGSLYIKQAFTKDSKEMVKELIDKVRSVFVDTLDELNWMDEESKKKAQEKAMNIREQIGYPDYILEEHNRHLDEEYSSLIFSEELYFENGLQNLKASAQRSLKKLREKVDQNLWIIGAAVVNAFYSPNRNQIVFPAGILQPPFFSKEQPQSLNFGGIGMVIGHEITHGFDDNGRNFDKNGNMLDWWSNFSAQHFREQSQCMIYQYGNFSWDLADDQNVNGFSTLGENIADNGGVRQAYKVWCGSYRPEFAVQSIKTDVHSPLKYRVLGSLQNLAAFSEAFHCPRGSPMHPKKRCRIW
ncbi:membrane metallo-endopeptidase-like 1 isoform X4 [Peromyscus californicus insignis]|uniref:membrane metallo-endopeptidase-like 1 isoform X4 n=1 Tax=Peromyscus californicus insignis TaxID=564181 RepID=UPI0022A73F61|nr:membrane metallo-endopeptidase-like 1 isoform X4 [Peromyscus californicus insignis]